VTGEDMAVNDDEFDYIYYTYGLNVYGNVPLVEPLEYKELHKVKEFVIAIDTSASCRGSVVRAFLNKTYSILKGTENFFHKINVHIIQCDQEVQSDTKITCDDDFETFMKYGKLKGFGATDFRPVFTYVEQLREQGEFENLKGLIYFTDGYGIYPEKNPGYDVIFAFLEEDEHRMPVPPWALKVVIEDEAIEGNE
jgi:predicted metal-dependent peptidase